MHWYKLTPEEACAELASSETGLTQKEAKARLKRFGPNQLAIRKDPFWKVLLEPFNNIFTLVLVTAATISYLNHETLDALVIGIIIAVNVTIYYSQTYATNRVLRSLKKHSIQQVHIIREGEKHEISSLNLVPGDIVLLEEGERVPADMRILHGDNLQTDESSLTGESLPVHKNNSTFESTKAIYSRTNMVFQGTYVVSGSARAIVVETGARTEFGQVAELASQKPDKSPVQAKIDKLISNLVKVIAVIVVVAFVLALARDMAPAEAVRFVLALSVSAVPEGLPIALTAIIVLGMRRMAKQKALVRSFKAIEDIGLITTIATDKTGTLTKNHLKVVDMWALKGDIKEHAQKTLGAAGASTDPLDVALREFTGSASDSAFVTFYPFDLSLRSSGAYVKKDKSVYIKGSPEHIIQQSNLSSHDKTKAESMLRTFAAKGYRVVAISRKSAPKPVDKFKQVFNGKLELLGLVAFADELRPEAKSAIHQAQKAGINVKLITGDHFDTAYEIGNQLGLASHHDQVIQGDKLPRDIVALARTVKQKTIFARILPEDKFRILKALKRSEITAMTGDGVNDVPALAGSHVGIAMGSGSDIAKDAGGMVLLNDNFATIIKALSEGRKIYDNIRRMLYYLLSTTTGEVLTMIGALLVGLPLPVTAIQILWINLVTDTAMVLPLGLEPAEKGHMKRPPRDPKEPLLSKVLITRMVLVALAMAIPVLITVKILSDRGYELAYIQTVAFMMLISVQWMNAFNARSEQESLFKRLKQPNYSMLVGLLIAASLQALVMFGPLSGLLGVTEVDSGILLVSSISIVLTALAVVELHKYIIRRQERKLLSSTK